MPVRHCQTVLGSTAATDDGSDKWSTRAFALSSNETPPSAYKHSLYRLDALPAAWCQQRPILSWRQTKTKTTDHIGCWYVGGSFGLDTGVQLYERMIRSASRKLRNRLATSRSWRNNFWNRSTTSAARWGSVHITACPTGPRQTWLQPDRPLRVRCTAQSGVPNSLSTTTTITHLMIVFHYNRGMLAP